MLVRAARDGDIEPACAVLDAAFGRPDEAQLFRTLRAGDELALALVALGPPDGSETGVTSGAAASSPSLPHERGGRRTGPGDSEDVPIVGIAVLSHLVAPAGCVGLGPLAVAPDHRDRGIGKALIAESVERARRAGHGAIFVLGQPPWYTRFGFSIEAARPFRSEYPAEFLLALELKPGALDGGGELRYAPAFAGL